MDELDRQTALRLSAEMRERLGAEARRTGRSVSGLIRWILTSYLEELPDAPHKPPRVKPPRKSKTP